MGRGSKAGRKPARGRKPSARSSGRKRRPPARRARAKVAGARGGAGAAYHLEMTGAMDATTLAAVELEVRQVAKRYRVQIEAFRVKVRRRSG